MAEATWDLASQLPLFKNADSVEEYVDQSDRKLKTFSSALAAVVAEGRGSDDSSQRPLVQQLRMLGQVADEIVCSHRPEVVRLLAEDCKSKLDTAARLAGEGELAQIMNDLEPVSYTHLTLPTSDLV